MNGLSREVSRSFDPEAIGCSPSQGRAYVYVLPCYGENLLKLGFSRDPFERMAAFHARYFEFFDLDRAFAIEVDRVGEARQLERLFATPLQAQRAPSPLTVRDAAGGHTEWYRGAYGLLEQQARRASHDGRRVHWPLTPWVRTQLQQRAAMLFDWSHRALEEIELDTSAGLLASLPLRRHLRNSIDALIALQIPIESYIPVPVLQWHVGESGHDLAGNAHAA